LLTTNRKDKAMALDPVIQDKITTVVSQWVNEGKMFTAFEVSLAVKEEGVRERHRHMRDTVHEIIFRIGGPNGYTRTLMDVGAPEQAWVYHPMRSNPYTYRPLNRDGYDPTPADVPTIVPSGIRNPIKLVWGSSANASIPDGAYGTDQRGRLTIPVGMLHKLGIGPGQRVKVQCEADREQLTVTKLGDFERTTPDAAYTAEPDGNVRITQTTLDKANIAGMQCYRIQGDDASITIRKFA
jgi:bifunctional DNA-binding transcriptional regulator/antitoxin component of YhaV-PrlF toxin-antitoxin module